MQDAQGAVVALQGHADEALDVSCGGVAQSQSGAISLWTWVSPTVRASWMGSRRALRSSLPVKAAVADDDGDVIEDRHRLIVGRGVARATIDGAEVADFLHFAADGFEERLGLLAEAHAGGNLVEQRNFFVDAGELFGDVGEFAVR